jgi:hypothetical protein
MTKSLTEIKSLARSHTATAMSALAGIAQNGQSESARVAASVALLDRGWGKPAQPIAGDDESPLTIQLINRVIKKP